MLLGLPLAPVRGLVALAEVLREQAEQELYSPSAMRRQLEEVTEERAAGEISEQEEQELQQQILGRVVPSGVQSPDEQAR